MLMMTVVRFYTMSLILGTVAFSYGSVPLYKMVGTNLLINIHELTYCVLDLSNYGLGWTTGPP